MEKMVRNHQDEQTHRKFKVSVGIAGKQVINFEALPEVGVDYANLGPEGSQVTIFVCKCKRTGCLAASQVPEKGMNVYAPAFLTGWLRGLGWKRLLLRSDNERALLTFLRAAAASLEGVEVIEQASPQGNHAANGLAEVGVREVMAQTRVLKSHLEERRKTAGLEWTAGDVVGSTLSDLLVKIQNSNLWENARSAAHRKTLETSSC